MLRRQRGSITAEFAAVVPAVMLVLALCLGGLQLSSRQLQVQDAAALAARSAARGASFDAAVILPGATTRIERRSNLVCAVVTMPGRPLAGILGAVEVSASSCSLRGGG
jgi:Flp pilus assembly protein TadG